MVDRNLITKLGLSNEQIEQEVNELFTSEHTQLLEEELAKKVESLAPGTIVTGRIVTQLGNDVIVELGLKSEGMVEASEFDDPEEIVPGKEIEVLLEEMDAESGILLSKRKADRIRGWERVIENNAEGDVVKGIVSRRIKGGLLIDIGVPVFLPASQVDIRKPGDISRFIGQEIECKILKIDTDNHNIVVSRRKIIEEERYASKEKILAEIEVGQLRTGIVKNIADFGVFVDLGGLDGLLHISDLSWGRISHPSELVELDQEIECMVIGVDKDNEKISLGLKQKSESPWKSVEGRYPIGNKVTGKIVNIMNYGAFVRLEEGIEGLIHISEMSWTKRIGHPGDILTLGEDIEVQVLGDFQGNYIHLGERECSLQRRHQKLIEESPSFVVDEAMRAEMGTVAIEAARSVDYVSAGTVEFLVDKEKNFYFLEMNTRVQVEHPVTELVTGVDIVQEQLRVARGRKLRYGQDDVRLHGWAIECRINAEDPYNDFMPSTGTITTVILPTGPGVRVDTGVYSGYEVTPYYDSLISKLICYGETRGEAVLRMRRALEEYRIMGVKTNIPFHQHMMDSHRFMSGSFDTMFVEERFSMSDREGPDEVQAAILATLVAHRQGQQASQIVAPGERDTSNWKWLSRWERLSR